MTERQPCPVCDGEGVDPEAIDPSQAPRLVRMPCETCRGAGVAWRSFNEVMGGLAWQQAAARRSAGHALDVYVLGSGHVYGAMSEEQAEAIHARSRRAGDRTWF